MKLYLLLDLIVAAGPLALSFDRKVAYFRSWPAAMLSILAVGLPFLVWDMVAAKTGVWSFSAEHAGRAILFDLPLAEILFFFVVPFSCLFVYEVLLAYLPQRKVKFPRWAGGAVGLSSLAAAVLTLPRGYTAVVFGVLGLFFLLTVLSRSALLTERTTWLYLVACFVPFAIVNGVLTSVPVVLYNPREILGPRVFSIPIEDFFYSFSMLGLLILVYRHLRPRFRRPNTGQGGETQ